jgi:hypothetical protein
MKKPLTTIIMLIFIVFHVSAQKSRDVLYLKNGSTIFGKVIEINDNQYKFRTSEGSIFVYPSQDVEKLVNENLIYDGRKKSGLGFVLEGGFLIGAQSSDYKAPFSFNLLVNETINSKHIFGIGSGVEYLGKPFTPIFVEYKYLFSEKRTVPFIFIRGGKLFHLNGDDQNSDNIYPQYSIIKTYKGGASFTLGTGISWSKETGETYLSFAYRNVYTSYTEKNYNNQLATYKNAYNRLEIKFGFKF